MIKTKKWPIILFILMSMSQLAQSQSYDQIIKLRAEYEKLKDGMLNELKLDIESYLTTFYRPK